MENIPVNRRILVVDDEEGVLDAYRIILEPSPAPTLPIASSRGSAARCLEPQASTDTFEVEYVTNGPQAIIAIEKAKTENHPFVGGFFDVKLGGKMDGIEVIRQAKKIDEEILCVMVTAYQDRTVDEIATIFGAEFSDRWDFLSKPFSRNEILQKARNLVANWNRKQREKMFIDQIQEQQQQLIQSESLAAIGNLARGIGHEFGNILLGIMGRAELALQKQTIEAMSEALKIISSSAERAGIITRNLQTLVKTDTRRELTDIQSPIKECTALIEHEIRKSNIKLIESFAPSLPLIYVSRVELGQVILNLVINAIHAMKENNGGTLTFAAIPFNEGLILEIRDTGCGISPDNMKKIFTAFFTTKGKNGSGIGLSVTKKIIENHGGKISVQSEQGKGTVFRLWLPKGSPHENL